MLWYCRPGLLIDAKLLCWTLIRIECNDRHSIIEVSFSHDCCVTGLVLSCLNQLFYASAAGKELRVEICDSSAYYTVEDKENARTMILSACEVASSPPSKSLCPSQKSLRTAQATVRQMRPSECVRKTRVLPFEDQSVCVQQKQVFVPRSL